MKNLLNRLICLINGHKYECHAAKIVIDGKYAGSSYCIKCTKCNKMKGGAHWDMRQK